MDPPILPTPPGLWKITPRPYFVNNFAPINIAHRDIPWTKPAEVVDSKDNHAVLEEEGLQVNELLGTGTYSTVHRAFWKAYKLNVAIKMYEKPREKLLAPAHALPALKRVTAEVETLKRLKHPNIVGFFGAMETKYRVYLILEVVENGNLLLYLKRHGAPGDGALSRKWFAQLTSAISHCHRQEIAHRDIKCENILLDTELNVRVSDFGFAMGDIIWYEDVHNDVFVKIDEYCGSLAYMSPEIVRRKPYCPILSDVWAMGIVLYGIIYAKFPYEVVNMQNIVELAGRFRAPVAEVNNVRISPHLDEIFHKIFQNEERRIRSYELLENKWIESEVDAAFLGKMGYLGKIKYEEILKDQKISMPANIQAQIIMDG